MGLGVLEDRKLQHVPGTATLEDLSQPTIAARRSGDGTNVKRNKDGIILVPQPSDDPNDPLNWPLWRRDLITLILCFVSVIATTLSPILAADTFAISPIFKSSLVDTALLTGYHLLGVGVAGFIFVPSARVWGKRHLYILGLVTIIWSSAWGGGSGSNYKSFLASRFFQGVGLAPFEALVNASIGDLYFVHESGIRMALSNLSLFGGAFLTPVIAGKMTATVGFKWTFYTLAIIAAAMLPVVFVLVPETAFVREDGEDGYHLDPVPKQSASLDHDNTGDDQAIIPKDEKVPDISTTDTSALVVPAPWISRRNIALFNGRKSSEPFFKLFLRPFPLFFHPGVLWACLIQGAMIGWTVLIGVVLAAVMFQYPLFFNEVQTGYLYTGAFIGAVIGFIIAGLLANSSIRWMTRLNGGVYEPEFRLLLVIPQLILGCAGLYGFGITSNDTLRYGWFWPDFFFALEVAGMVLGAVASALYIVDAYREIAVESFTCLLVFKNIFSFGLTFGSFNWLTSSQKARKIFIIIASVQAGICCTTILMYVFGKKIRSFFARNDILATLHLK